MPIFEGIDGNKDYLNSSFSIHALFSEILKQGEEYQQYMNNPQKVVTDSLCDYFTGVPMFAKRLDEYAGSIGITKLSFHLFKYLSERRSESQVAFKNYLYYILLESPTILLPIWYYQQNTYTPDQCRDTLYKKLTVYHNLVAHLLSKNRNICILDISGTTCNAIYRTASLLPQNTHIIRIIKEVPVQTKLDEEFMRHVCDFTRWQQILSSDIMSICAKSPVSVWVSSRFWFWNGFVVSKGMRDIVGEISSIKNAEVFVALGPFKCFFHNEATKESIGLTNLLYRQVKHRMDNYEVLPFRYVDHVIAT